MSLAPGARLGAYEVVRLIGAGGMGEVYQARDTRLDRLVAIKVLPEKLAGNQERRQRFEREARAVAALNHPHICDLHDVGAHDSVDFLVMEYVEGQTLAERLVRGPLPPADVLRYATELADALDHAHRRGLVHRDLKPGNVMLTNSGTKLLDFGLSKLQSTPDLIGLSTIASGPAPLTAQGAVLGTYPYMAPEQLEGRETDARSDIFAFGAIVYEMATGRRAFQGATAASLIGAILHTDPPPVSTLQPLTPRGLDRIVSRCLAKNPDDRWQTARDLVLELKWIAEQGAPPVADRRRQSKLGLVAATALAVLAIAATWFAVAYLRRSPAETFPVRLALPLPASIRLADLAVGGPVTISPDGRRLAFVAKGDDGKQLLWVRQLDVRTAQALPGTDGASFPFWSPDSRRIGFFAKGGLSTIDPADGRPPHKLCEVKQPRGGTWSKTDVIVFSGNAGDELFRVSADGGPMTPLPGKRTNRENLWPTFLPDGRHIIYFGRPDSPGGIFVTTLDSDRTILLARDYVGAVYASGHLLMLSSGSSTGGSESAAVMAQPFDAERLELSDQAVVVQEQIRYHGLQGRGAISVSENGTLVTESSESPLAQLTWFDRAGKEQGTIGEPARHRRRPALSPDGKIVAVERLDPLNQSLDIGVIDIARKLEFPLTSNPAIDFNPVWSPTGLQVVFSSARDGTPPTLYVRPSSSAGREERILSPGFIDQAQDWTRDGRFILFARLDPKTQWDLWALPALPESSTGERKPVRVVTTEANEHNPQASPDGRWLAYESDESWNWEVFVRPFMPPTENNQQWQISTNGGIWPKWSRDGKELFFVSASGDLMTAAIKPGRDFQFARPQALFKRRIADMARRASSYTPAADGQRFLINSYLEDTTPPPVSVLLNWPALLPR
jgi:Tol biopolymer transport system component/aminoglycoside phosphotransferase (APT) family kinase protein